MPESLRHHTGGRLRMRNTWRPARGISRPARPAARRHAKIQKEAVKFPFCRPDDSVLFYMRLQLLEGVLHRSLPLPIPGFFLLFVCCSIITHISPRAVQAGRQRRAVLHKDAAAGGGAGALPAAGCQVVRFCVGRLGGAAPVPGTRSRAGGAAAAAHVNTSRVLRGGGGGSRSSS